ncbi:MAG: 1-acyl-sn-glycerol-3-phosphate acyltransferase [Planctomycetes bacterium]|nr:1-acyl-sn-glycerol-3-phosphate acyltransferase [Planctomycetota bacterium]
MLAWLLRLAARVVARTFYRRIRVSGQERVPRAAPVIFVLNHQNAMVDPVLLLALEHRPIHFIAKAQLFEVPLLRTLIRAAGAIPVYRAEEFKDAGEANRAMFGRAVEVLRAGHGLAIFPEGKSHVEPRVQELKTGAARILFAAMDEGLSSPPPALVPVGITFSARHLFRSEVAVVFGAPIRLADLAWRRQEDEWGAVRELTERIRAGLESLTVNLDSWADHRLVSFAEALHRLAVAAGEVPAPAERGSSAGGGPSGPAGTVSPVGMPPPDGGDPNEAGDEGALEDEFVPTPLPVPLPLPLRPAAGRPPIGPMPLGSLTPGETRAVRVERLQTFARGLARLRATDPERAAALAHRVGAFARRLETLRLSPRHLQTRYTEQQVSSFILWNLFALTVVLPFAMVGTVAHYVPYWISGMVAHRLAQGSVDLPATYKIYVGLLAFPAMYCLEVAAASLLLGGWAGLAAAVLVPILGFVALGFWERRDRLRTERDAYLLLSKRPDLAERLRRRRAAVVAEIAALAESYAREGHA